MHFLMSGQNIGSLNFASLSSMRCRLPLGSTSKLENDLRVPVEARDDVEALLTESGVEARLYDGVESERGMESLEDGTPMKEA